MPRKDPSKHKVYIKAKYHNDEAYREAHKKRVKSWKVRNKAKVLASKYASTEDEVLRLQAEAAGKCRICKREKPLVLDHCHKTGKLRGFLCSDCNLGLGRFEDNIEFLQAATEYLS